MYILVYCTVPLTGHAVGSQFVDRALEHVHRLGEGVRRGMEQSDAEEPILNISKRRRMEAAQASQEGDIASRAKAMRGDPVAGGANGDGAGGTGEDRLVTLPPYIESYLSPVRRTIRARGHYCIPLRVISQPWLSTTVLAGNDTVPSSFPILGTNWLTIPYNDVGFYGPYRYVQWLQNFTAGFRVHGARFTLSNFTSHSENVSSGAPVGSNMNYNGISFETIVANSQDTGPVIPYARNADGTYGGTVTRINMNSFMTNEEISTTQGEYSPWPYYLGQRVVQINSTSAGYAGNIGIKQLQPLSQFSLNSPAVCDFEIKNSPKSWYPSRLIHQVAPLWTGSTAGANAANIIVDTNGPCVAEATHGTDPYLPEGWLQRTAHMADIVPVVDQSTIRIGPVNAMNVNDNTAPTLLNDLVNTDVSPTIESKTNVFAFRPIIPPRPTGTAPDLMICFTIDRECDIEYIPIDSHSFNRFMVMQGDFNVSPPSMVPYNANPTMAACITAINIDDTSASRAIGLASTHVNHFPKVNRTYFQNTASIRGNTIDYAVSANTATTGLTHVG